MRFQWLVKKKPLDRENMSIFPVEIFEMIVDALHYCHPPSFRTLPAPVVVPENRSAFEPPIQMLYDKSTLISQYLDAVRSGLPPLAQAQPGAPIQEHRPDKRERLSSFGVRAPAAVPGGHACAARAAYQPRAAVLPPGPPSADEAGAPRVARGHRGAQVGCGHGAASRGGIGGGDKAVLAIAPPICQGLHNVYLNSCL